MDRTPTQRAILWRADQLIDPTIDRFWGYNNLASTQKSSSKKVANTNDDRLYQTWRTAPGSYVFAVPNATYDVTLRFAEFEVGNASDRVMRVTINGVVVETDAEHLQPGGKRSCVGSDLCRPGDRWQDHRHAGTERRQKASCHLSARSAQRRLHAAPHCHGHPDGDGHGLYLPRKRHREVQRYADRREPRRLVQRSLQGQRLALDARDHLLRPFDD